MNNVFRARLQSLAINLLAIFTLFRPEQSLDFSSIQSASIDVPLGPDNKGYRLVRLSSANRLGLRARLASTRTVSL